MAIMEAKDLPTTFLTGPEARPTLNCHENVGQSTWNRTSAFHSLLRRLEQRAQLRDVLATRLRNIVYTVKAVSSTGALQAANIDAQVDTLLHDATLTVTGFSNFWCAREGDIDYVETDPDAGNVWHAGGTYRIRLAGT